MNTAVIEILILLLLILLNGVFAMSEMAVVSSRRARLQQSADEGSKGAQEALELAAEPSSFLSTVQIGITLVGVMAGAFGGATLAGELALVLDNVPLLAPYSRSISVGVVVMAITFLTLVLGELVPKRIALGNAERVAAAVARPMHWLARVAAPLVWLLGKATDLTVNLLRVQPDAEQTVTEEEIIIMLEQATQGGSVAPLEEKLVGHVFRLGDRRVSALLTPRPDIVFMDVDDSPQVVLHKLADSGHSRFPVVQGDLDQVVGVVLTKSLLVQRLQEDDINVMAVMQPPLFVPEGIPALDLLERFKKTRTQMALVLDEYGGLEGLVTVNDILEALVGDMPEPGDEDPEIVKRSDGSWLVDGRLPIDEFLELINARDVPPQEAGAYQTMGGLVMTALERVPHIGDQFFWQGWQMEVVDMDGRRVDRVLVSWPGADDGETAVVDQDE